MEREGLYVTLKTKINPSLFLFVKGENNMKESTFQKKLINTLKKIFPGALVLKNDARYIDSIPDLTVLYKNRWALLEVKESEAACRRSKVRQPNQSYYISKGRDWSYASYVYPENVDQVLDELREVFA